MVVPIPFTPSWKLSWLHWSDESTYTKAIRYEIIVFCYEPLILDCVTILFDQDYLHKYVFRHALFQGCQIVWFKTKNTNLGLFWRALEGKILDILWPFGIFYGHLVYFMAIWYILWPFGIFYGHLE
jgi:hypothetical protein